MPEIKGLSQSEIKQLLEKHGPNALPEKTPDTTFKIILNQLKNPLVYVLLAASLITLALNHWQDSLIILLAVATNSILGFIQERKAGKALYALQKMLTSHAVVIRDGQHQEIPIEQIVPGDICVLNQGNKIPADGRLIDSNRLFVSEALLTGESTPISKKTKDEVYMGSIVVSGRGLVQIHTTGHKTKMGEIAQSVQQPTEETPLRRQLASFSKNLSIMVLCLTVFVFLVGLAGKRDIVEIFGTSVALAVSAIPEGLLIGMTVVLAIGMQRILKRNGLVRNLVSAETLGGVSVICLDKTGTLTEGNMRVVEVAGKKEEIIRQAIVANDQDDPIVIALWEWAKKHLDESSKSAKDLVQKYPRIDSIPFSSAQRMSLSLNKDGEKVTIFINGAPEYILDRSNLSLKEKERIREKIEGMTASGMRLLGLGKKTTDKVGRLTFNDIKSGVEWVGLVGFNDPVRKGIGKALKKVTKAGIEPLIITGDYAQTAVAVMSELEFEVGQEEIMLGKELREISDQKLAQTLKEKKIKLFARTTPDQKLKIVEALKNNGEIVAMMGDGVNDAPALKKADIGVVVGEATDVAKETADLVLLDSNFETVVTAIEEGRGIYNNLRKIILYLMSDAFSEIAAVIGSIILFLPLPVTAVQILWINLVSDGLPHLALTVDPKTPDDMKKPPRSSSEPLVANWMKTIIATVSVFSGLSALLVFMYIFNSTRDEVLARSASFMILGINSLVYVYSVKSLTKPFWETNPLNNKWLNLSVVSGFVLQLIPFSTPFMRSFFRVTWLGTQAFLLIALASFMVVIFIEFTKVLVRKKLSNHPAY